MWGATVAFPRYKESYIVTMVDKYWAVKEAVTPMRKRWAKDASLNVKRLIVTIVKKEKLWIIKQFTPERILD